jgi:hypothetical protein
VTTDFPATADTRLTGTDSLSVDPDRAGATLRHSASVFWTCDTEFVAQDPEQRHFGNDVNPVPGPIDHQFDHVDASFADIVVIIGAPDAPLIFDPMIWTAVLLTLVPMRPTLAEIQSAGATRLTHRR